MTAVADDVTRPAVPHVGASPRQPVVLALLDWYLPGYRAGGPVTAMASLFRTLAGRVDFHVLTRNHDIGVDEPYTAAPWTWHRVGDASVCYAPPAQLGPRALRRIIDESRPDVLWLNSVFSARFTLQTLLLRRAGAFRGLPMLISARGELAPGCLAKGERKKALYLAAVRALGLYDGLVWHATAEHEANDIRRAFTRPGHAPRIALVPDPIGSIPPLPPPRSPRAGRPLTIAFLSRVNRVKGLHVALAALARTTARVRFDIHGPLEDAAYVSECRALAARLPANVEVTFFGAIDPASVAPTLEAYDAFLLPTAGENFGHAILEALAAGCPVIISDRTRWRDLPRQHAGWDLPLDDVDAFARTIDAFAALDDRAAAEWHHGARAFAEATAAADPALDGTYRLFTAAAQGAPPFPTPETRS